MKRRAFISALTGGVMVAPGLFGRPKSKARFKGAGQKKLVVLFQRGGCDGLNMMVPADASEHALYMGLRPDIGIPTNQLMNIPGSGGFFGLHPAMSALAPVMAAGDLSLIHAVGYPNPDRSHFESQSYYETAVPGNALLDGWLNRYLAHTSGPGLIRGLSIGYNIPQSVTGSIAVPVSQNFGQLDISIDPWLDQTEGDAYKEKIRQIYQTAPSTGNDNLYNTGDKIFQMLDNFSDRDLQTYVPQNGAVYPSTYFAPMVMHAAQMLKDDQNFLGVEVIAIDQGGYDTHANQVSAGNVTNPNDGQGYLLKELADCMAAFYTDMGPARMADTILLVVSEFGRRAYQNDSLGTDHGTGSVVLAMGGGVNGGTFNGGGAWPGLDNLYEDDDLMWVTDFRDIYWEIMSRHIGVNNTTLQTIIPGHSYSPVGFVP